MRRESSATFLRLSLLSIAALGVLWIHPTHAAGFATVSPMLTPRNYHTATLLPTGKVLVSGGYSTDYLSSAELYDPATGAWAYTGSLVAARQGHTATMLLNGKVLVAGGFGSGLLKSAELYDPATGTWASTGALSGARYHHTATLLNNGKVLVAGGSDENSVCLKSAELYDPALGTWTSVGSLFGERRDHTATLLPNGKVLVAGGTSDGFTALNSAEVYDPAGGSWTSTNPLGTLRILHTATLLPTGKVLVAGGYGNGSNNFVNSAELYDPTAGTWADTGAMANNRSIHTASLLPNGKVLVAGGFNGASFVTNAEVYDPTLGTWANGGAIAAPRELHTATLLASGRVLIAGGYDGDNVGVTEVYDSTSGGAWSGAGNLGTAREAYASSPLPSGKVFVVGGFSNNGQTVLSSAERYDPVANSWTTAGNMNAARNEATATLLPSGNILVVGGSSSGGSGALTSAELYDPVANSWSGAKDLTTARRAHSATLLTNGKVLVVGGDNASGYLNTAELYDPALNIWSATGSLTVARRTHTATLLTNGKVLVAGGEISGGGGTNSVELYDPATNTWNSATNTISVRNGHSATLLPNGKVLVAAGNDNTAELYDPISNIWNSAGILGTARYGHAAALLQNGKVLVAGGHGFSTFLNSAELYDPSTNQWSAAGNLNSARSNFSGSAAIVLPSGKVLLAGGYNGTELNSAELYDSGVAFTTVGQPNLTTATSPLSLGSPLLLTGTKFKGVSEASGGSTNNSASNYPLVQIQSLANGQSTLLIPDANNPFSDTSYKSIPLSGFPLGYAAVTVFVNGIPSDSKLISIAALQTAATTTSIGTITPANSVVGQLVNIPFTVTSTTQGTITGNVTVGDGTTSVTVAVETGSASLAFSTAGTHTITVSYQGAGVFGPSVASTQYSVNKGTATVTLGNLTQVYDGTPKIVSVTTTPANLAATVTYNTSTTAPTTVGSYAVAATINDANYTGSANGTLVINKAAATVTLGNLSQTFDGTPKSVSVTTTPAGLTVAVTYNGSSNPPTLPGSYAVVATINDPLYAGSANGNLVINKIPTTTAGTNSSANFSLNAQTINLSASVSSTSGTVNEGTLTFQILDGSTPVGTAVTSATLTNGAAQVAYTLPAFTVPNNYKIQIAYSGGATFAPSTDATKKLVVLNTGPTTPGNPPVIDAISISRNPVRTNTIVTFTALARSTSGLPITSYEWFFYFNDSPAPDGPSIVTLDPVQRSFDAAGTYTVAVVASDGVAKSAQAKTFTVTLDPNPGTSAKNIFTDGTGVTNPANDLGLVISDSLGGVLHIDTKLPGGTSARAAGIQFNYLLDNQPLNIDGVSLNGFTASKYLTPGIKVIEVNTTSGGVTQKARLMVPISAPEVGSSLATTDTRTSKGTTLQSLKGQFSKTKTSFVTLTTSIEMSSGLALSEMSPLELGISNLHTSLTMDGKGKVLTNSNPLFRSIKLKLPKVDKVTQKTLQGARMVLTFTVQGQDLSKAGFDTEGIVPVVPFVKGQALDRKLQFAALIAGMSYQGLLSVVYSPNAEFGTIGARH